MHNKVLPKGSIVKVYIAIECITFCSIYLDDIKIRFNRTNHNIDCEWGDNEPILSIFKQMIRSTGERRYKFMDINELFKVYFYVLNNYKKIKDFIK